jgi:hypothetical protein
MDAKSIRSHNRWKNKSRFYKNQGLSDETLLWNTYKIQIWNFVSSWILDLCEKEHLELS